MDEPRDSKDGTVEKEEVVAGQSDAHTSDESAKGYGIGHCGRAKRQEPAFPHRSLMNWQASIHVLSVDGARGTAT